MILAHRALLRPIRPTPAFKAIRTLSFRPTTPISLPRRNLPSSSFLAKRQKPLRIRRRSSQDRLLPPLPFVGPLNSIDNDDFDQILPLEQVRRSLNSPVPTECERLNDLCLNALFFSGSILGLLPEKDQREFMDAYHPERLEFLGDRIWSEVVAQAVFLIAPVTGTNLRYLHDETTRLTTNEMATKLAHGVGLHCYRGETLDDAQAADRFEAYLAALSSANGRRSLLKFLVPLVQREFFARFTSIPRLEAKSVLDPSQKLLAAECSTTGPILGHTENLTTAIKEFRTRVWKHHLEQCLSVVVEVKLKNYTIATGHGLSTHTAYTALLSDATKKGFIIVEPTFAPRRSDLPLQYRSHAQIDSQAVHDLLDLGSQGVIRLTHTWRFSPPGQEAISHSGSGRYSAAIAREMVRKCCLAGLLEVENQASLSPTKSELSPTGARSVLSATLPTPSSSPAPSPSLSSLSTPPPASLQSTSPPTSVPAQTTLTPAVPTTLSPTLPPIATPTASLEGACSTPVQSDVRVVAALPSSKTFPDSETTARFSDDAASPRRRVFHVIRQPPTNKGRQKLHLSLIRLADDVLRLELHFNFPRHGEFSCSGRSFSEAAAALYKILQQKGLATKNLRLPEERTSLPLNYHRILPHIVRDFEKLCPRRGSVRWKYELKLPGWEPVSRSGEKIGTTLTYMPLFQEYVKIGAICVVDSDDEPLQQLMLYNAHESNFDDSAIDEAGAIDEQEPASHFSSSPSALTPSSTPALDESPDLDLPEYVGSTASPPPLRVDSFDGAFDRIAAIPGCEIVFRIKVVLPGYGVAEASCPSQSRAKTVLIEKLTSLGVVTRDRTIPLQSRALPFNYHDQFFYLLFNLEGICRDLPDSSIQCGWSVTAPNRPQLAVTVEGREIRNLNKNRLVRAALEAGYIEIKPSKNLLPNRRYSSRKSRYQALSAKPAPSPPSSSPSFLDSLSEPFSSNTPDLTQHVSAAATAPDDPSPSDSTTKEKS